MKFVITSDTHRCSVHAAVQHNRGRAYAHRGQRRAIVQAFDNRQRRRSVQRSDRPGHDATWIGVVR